MDYHFIMPVLIAFGLSVIMGPVIIPILRKLKMDQTEREDGVKAHLKKAGTPTMGGVMILGSIVLTSLFYIKDYPRIIPVLFVTLGFGLIGVLDRVEIWDKAKWDENNAVVEADMDDIAGQMEELGLRI